MSRYDDVEHCRAYGHRWDSITIGIAQSWYEEVLECEICKATRTDEISRVGKDKGRVLKRKYKYILDPFWENKPDKHDARASALKKAAAKVNKANKSIKRS